MEDLEDTIIATESRQPKSSTEDPFLAETLRTEHTINAWLSFSKKPPSHDPVTREVRTLVSLGFGLNGYPHILHDSVVATLMDEAMALLISANKSKRKGGQGCVTGDIVTAGLNITFLKTIATPQILVVTTCSREFRGRKLYVDASINDRFGTVLASADSLWIQISPKMAKL